MRLITVIGLVFMVMLITSMAYAEGDASKGKQVYMANCIACHNPDPSKDGAVGPAVKGSSRDLIFYRVTKAEYPPGYKPKRDTKLMMKLEMLAPNVDDLAAFLK